MVRDGTKWSDVKLTRFVTAWNDGVTIQALKERFGVKNPAAMAASLRIKGMEIAERKHNVHR